MTPVVDTGAAAGRAGPRAWSRALPAFLAVMVALAVPFWETGASLAGLWRDNASYGHGWLILPVSLYLLWLRRTALRREVPCPSWVGVCAVAVLMALWLLSRMLGILMGEQLVLVGMLLALPLAILGPRVAALAAPPVLYLLCAIPVWSYLVPYLQVSTAAAASSMVRALGVPVFLDGLYMSIPDGRFVVADVCSGLRYLLASLSLAGCYALLNLHAWWARLTLVAAGFVLGVVFNYVRVAGIVLIGHHSRMQSPLVESHIGYGWTLFLMVVVGVLALGHLLSRVDGAAGLLPDSTGDHRGAVPGAGRFRAGAALALVLVLAPAALVATASRPPANPPTVELADLDGLAGWRIRQHDGVQGDGSWRPDYPGADASVLASFTRGNERVDVFIAFYSVQRQGAEAVNESNRVSEGRDWDRFALTQVPPLVEPVAGVPMEEFLIRRADTGHRRIVWRTGWINETFTARALEAKAQQLLGLVRGHPSAAAVVLSTPLDHDGTRGRAVLSRFVQSALPGIQDVLAAAARRT